MKKLILISALVSTFFSCTKEETKAVDLPTKEKVIEIKTSFGNMYMWLYKETPLHRANFLALADTNFFDNTTFHRCVTNFVIQGGDPNSKDADPLNDGSGGPGFTVPAEISTTNSKLTHTYGAVGAARLGDAANPLRASSGSQFYIVIPTAGTPNLNGAYTVFGRIIKGMDVAAAIVKQTKDANNRPIVDIKMDVNILDKSLEEMVSEYNFVP